MNSYSIRFRCTINKTIVGDNGLPIILEKNAKLGVRVKRCKKGNLDGKYLLMNSWDKGIAHLTLNELSEICHQHVIDNLTYMNWR